MFSTATDTDFNIDRHLLSLLETSPFFAEISRHVRKVITRDLPTAGVAFDIHSDDFVMGINPDFFASLTKQEINGILRHEFYHIIFLHITNRRKKPHMRWNVATDLAINSIIMNPDQAGFDRQNPPLPDIGLVPGRHLQGSSNDPTKKVSKEYKAAQAISNLIASLPTMETSEFYFDKLSQLAEELHDNCPVHGKDAQDKQENSQEKQKSDQGESEESDSGEHDEGNNHQHDENGEDECTCGGANSLDDHSGWDEIPEDMREYVEGKARHLIEKAAKHADSQSNGWGNMPSSIRDEIRKMIHRTLDWKQILRQFIGSINRGGRSTSIRRINRKYPYIHPGVKRNYIAKLAIAIDQSGSVSDHMLAEFFAEIESLTKNISVTIIPFDATVEEKNVFEWRKGQRPKLNRVKSGGTSFDAATEYVNSSQNRGRWDGIIYLTDGECCKPMASRVKRGWILGSGCKLGFQTDEMQASMDKGTPNKGAWR